MLTVEDDETGAPNTPTPNSTGGPAEANILPFNLYTTYSDFYTSLGDHYFNWRWFKADNGSEYRVVTIEDFSDESITGDSSNTYKATDFKLNSSIENGSEEFQF